LGIEVLEVRDRELGQRLTAVSSFCEKVPRPFVVHGGVPYGEHLRSIVARRQRIREGLVRETTLQRVARQLRGRGALYLEHLESPTMQHPPPRLPGFGVGHLPYLLVGEREGGAAI
jgi:hypothetical protein